MKQLLIYFGLCIFVAACAPTVALPTIVPSTSTPSITATQTFTPSPTSTMTPTLEPWMQSLPEDVLTVEKDGDTIFGLDAEGKRVMEFNLESSEWIAVGDPNSITYMDENGTEVTAKMGQHTYTNKSGETVHVPDPGELRAHLKFIAERVGWLPPGSDSIDVLRSFLNDPALKEYLEQFDINFDPVNSRDCWAASYPQGGGSGSPFFYGMVTNWDGGTLFVTKGDDGSYFSTFFAGEAEKEFMGEALFGPDSGYMTELANGSVNDQ